MGLARTPPQLQFSNKLEDIQESPPAHATTAPSPPNAYTAVETKERSATPPPLLSTSLNGHASNSDKETVDYLKRQLTMLSTRNRELSLSKQDLQIRLENTHTQHQEALNQERSVRQEEAETMVAHMTKLKEIHKATLSKWKEELAVQTANREEIERRYLASEEDLDRAYDQIDALNERVNTAENALTSAESKHRKEIEKCKSEYHILSEKCKRDANAYEENIASVKEQSGNKKDTDRRLQRYQAKIDALNAEIDSLKDKVEAAKDDQIELEQADETISELRRSLEKMQKETKSSKVERAFERKLKASEAEIDALKSELKSVERSVEKRVKKQIEDLNEGEFKSLQKQLNKQKEKATIILADLKESERNRVRFEKKLNQMQDSSDVVEMHTERADKAERRIKKLESTIEELKSARREQDEASSKKLSKKPSYTAAASSDEEDDIDVRTKSKPQPKPRKRKVESDDEEDAPAPKAKRAQTAKKDDKKTKKKINIFGNGPPQPHKGGDGGLFGIPDVLSPVKSKSTSSKGTVGRGPFA